MANVINSLKLGSGTYVFTTPYATCGTAAAEAAKVAATTPGSNFSLETGARITVKFTVTNTASSPTLNVNSTGAKPIYYRGQPISASYLMANRTYEFIYNGTQYELVGDLDSNTAHNHSAGVGLAGSGNAGISGGTYTYKAKLKDETANANDSLARPAANANRLYPVEVDKSGYLAVTVPWSDTNTDTDTKNTAGSTDTSSKIFLIGATSQAANPQTYSHDTAYVGTDGCLYSNSSKVATLGDTNIFTAAGNTFTGALSVRSSSDSNIQTAIGPTGFSRTDGTSGYTYTLPSNSGTLALTSDIVKNTAGSTDTSSKIYLIGATSQDTNPQTYSHDTAYVGTNGCLYSNSQMVATMEGANEFTGPNIFASNVSIKSSKGLTTQGSSALQYTKYNYGNITHVPDATNSSSNYTLTLPNKTGTIALTSDIPIKTATLSGTTLSITLS